VAVHVIGAIIYAYNKPLPRSILFSDDIAQVNHKNTKKKEKNGENIFHEKRGDPIPEYLWTV
jgi:hypothetical protein